MLSGFLTDRLYQTRTTNGRYQYRGHMNNSLRSGNAVVYTTSPERKAHPVWCPASIPIRPPPQPSVDTPIPTCLASERVVGPNHKFAPCLESLPRGSQNQVRSASLFDDAPNHSWGSYPAAIVPRRRVPAFDLLPPLFALHPVFRGRDPCTEKQSSVVPGRSMGTIVGETLQTRL